MIKTLHFFFFACCFLFFSAEVRAQACSAVPFSITDRDSICNGTCATITASLPTLRLTTSYTGSAIPFVPTIPCEGGGIAAPGSIALDDIHSTIIPIGFDFCFFGNTYTQCVLSANGYLTFNTALAGAYSPWAFTTGIPGGAVVEVRNSILAPYQDIDPSVSFSPTYVTYQTIGTAPWRAFVVKYSNIPMFSCTTLRHTSKIVMYETTNIIDVYIANKPVCATWNGGRAIEGIQNASGTVAYVVPGRNATVWTAVNDAYRWTPNGPQMPVQIYWYPVIAPGAPLASDTTVSLCPSLPGPFPTAIKYYARAVILDSCTTSLRRVDSLSLFDTTTVYVIGAYVTPYFREDTIRCSQDSLRLDAGPLGLQHSWIPLPSSTTRYKWVYNSGQYICFKFTDLDRCYLDSVVISVRDAPALRDSILRINSVRCHGDSSGYVVMSHWFNSGRVRYGLDGRTPAFGDTVRTIWAGSHYIIALDSFDCRDSIPFIMTEAPSIALTLDSLINARCFGTNTGRIRVSAVGGVLPYSYTWNSAPGSNILANVAAGSYIVAVIDSKFCAAVDTFLITQPTPLVVDSNIADSALCFGSCNGAARIFPSGSVPFRSGYQYAWSNGSISFSAVGLCAQSYYVTVTDSNGCQVRDTSIIPQPDVLRVNIIGVNPIKCHNGNDGSLILGGSGGSLSYSYSIDGFTYSPSTILSGFTFGPQVVRIKDAHNCLDDSAITFANPLRILPVISYTRPEACVGAIDGYVVVTPTNGTPSYSYSLDNITYSATDTLRGLAQGNYKAYVKDSNNCIDSVSFVMTRVAPLVLSLDSSNVTCHNGSDGTIMATIVGGTAAYQYSINGGPYSPSNIFNALVLGTYTIRIRDTNNCTTLDSIRVNQPLRILPTITVRNVTCFSYNNGSITLTPTNGFAPYSYAVDSGSFGASNIISSLSPGNHRAYVRDRYLCIDSIDFTITQPLGIIITLTAIRNISCFNGNNGLIRITASAGTRPYTYAWSSGSTFDSASALIAGSYRISVTDSNGCILVDTFTTSQPTLLTDSMNRVNLLCYGATTGSATVFANGGTPTYTYLWNDPLAQTTATATNLTARNYRVTITDLLGCRKIDSILVTQPDSLILNTVRRNVRCFSGNDGQINVSALGGSVPYQYSIGGGWQSSGLFNSLIIGTYTVTVRDTNGCSKSTSVTITQPLRIIPTIIANNPTRCNGSSDGSAIIGTTNGTAPFQYSLNNITYQASSTFAGLATGAYRAYVRDSLGCIDSVNFSITQPLGMILNVSSRRNVSCFNGNNGMIRIAVTNGRPPYTYAWSSGSSFDSASLLIANMYYVTVTDSNGCTITDSVRITQPTLLTGTMSRVNVLCHGASTGTTTITPSGGTPVYSYLWNDPLAQTTATASGLGAGNYRVLLTDNLGCRYTDSIVVTQPDSLTLSFTQRNITCFSGTDGQVIASLSGGVGPYQYNIGSGWQTFGTFNNLAAGTYTLTVKDFNNCTKNISITLTQPLRIIPTIVANNSASCNGFADGSVQIGTTNGFAPFQYSLNRVTYQVSNAFSGLLASNYRAYVTDSIGCIDSVDFVIAQPAAITLTVVPTQNKCHNDLTGAITISPRGGTAPYQYSIDAGATYNVTNSFSGLAAGIYSIIVKDRNNCTVSASATLNNPSLFTINATGFDVQCWDSENGRIIVATNGGTYPHSVFEYSQNGLVFNTVNNPLITNLAAGFYYIKALDANGCIATDTTTIARPAIDTFGIKIDSTTCYGAQYTDGSIIISALANPPYFYTIDGGPVQNYGIFYGLGAGNHLIIATNVNGCVDSLIEFVPFPPPVIVDVVPDTVYLELGASQQVQVIAHNATNPTYLWSSLQGLSCIDCPNPIVNPYNDMMYTVRVYDHSHTLSNYQCYGDATLYVRVEEHVKSYVPNAFTPGNGDGINDIFKVYGEGIKKLKFTIYDRWGELLFESNRQDYGWDGTYKGTAVEPGVYVYFVEAEYLDSKREEYQGSVTILR